MLAKKRERYSRCPLFLSLAVRNSGLCVCQILRFCRLLSSDFSRPVSYRKRKKMPASGFQSRFSRSQENRRLHICGFRRKYVTTDIPDDITTREEAIAYLEKNWKNMPFPKNAEYICDSEELDTEGDIVITSNNNEE